jgi:hypothetical protein
MWATYTARKNWFKAVVRELEPLGLNIVVLKQTIIITDSNLPGSKQKIINSEADFIKFAQSRRIEVEIPGEARAEAQKSRVRFSAAPAPRQEPPKEQPAPEAKRKPAPQTVDKAEARRPGDGKSGDAIESRVERLIALTLRAAQKRDAWERRALAAETQLTAVTTTLNDVRGAVVTDRKFDALRRFLAREFHPDYSTGDGVNKTIKAEIFKRIWPVVEEIDRST